MTASGFKSIWKFGIPVTDVFQLRMPQGSTILSVQVQNDDPQLWAMCDPDAPKERRTFRLIGTGHPILDSAELGHFVGTIQLNRGQLIFHLFEVQP